jgi:Zn-finger nucleic acid-binding protein
MEIKKMYCSNCKIEQETYVRKDNNVLSCVKCNQPHLDKRIKYEKIIFKK